MNRLLTGLTIVLMTATAAFAQSTRPPVEAGLGISGIAPVPYEDFGIAAPSPEADFRLTVPLTPRFSLEGEMTLTSESNQYSRTVEGLYQIGIKQRIARATRGGFHPFISYGVAGFFQHERTNPYTAILRTGTVTYPGYSFTIVDQPYGTYVGVGVQQSITTHVAIRTEAQLLTLLWIPLGTRFTAGASIPFGHYSRN